jgi:hypothetical protein
MDPEFGLEEWQKMFHRMNAPKVVDVEWQDDLWGPDDYGDDE